jgi:hypothetical protein
MDIFLLQIKHNQDFYDCICAGHPDNYYDWKITVSFYIAVHYLKALAYKKMVLLPSSHFDVEKLVNPTKGDALKLTHNAWDWYYNLYLYSRTARYSGFTEDPTLYMAIKKADYQYCEKYLTKFKNYMKGKGIQV